MALRLSRARLYVKAEGRAIRQAAGLPLAAVAAELGVSVATLSKWERGEVHTPAAAVLAWRRLLDRIEAEMAA